MSANTADNQPELAPPREWVLNSETEYRFELDAGTSLAIKVSYGVYVSFITCLLFDCT